MRAGGPAKIFLKFFWKKSHSAENCRTLPKVNHSLSLYIAEHTRLVPKTEELSAANQNRVLRQPSQTPFNFFNQLETSITSPESSANQNRVLRHPSRHYVTRDLSARV